MSRWIFFVVACLVLVVSAADARAAAAALTCPQSLAGQIDPLADGKQNGRLNRGQPATTCAAPTSAPAVVNPGSKFTYDAYTFKNRTAATACMTVTLTSKDDVAAAAYLGTFDPNDIQKSYLGDSGNRPTAGNPVTFSFDVASLSDFVVVVAEGVDGAGGKYTLSVSGCGEVVVTGITPNFGPTAGGTDVTIEGAGFVAGATVRLGGVLATNVVVVDEYTITARTPAHAAGAVDVVVRNPDGSTSTLAGGFTYYDPFASTLTLVSSANPSVSGQTVTFTATVAPTTPRAATGTVTFLDGAVVLGTATIDASGAATFSTSALSVGTHPITATYAGDSLFLPSTSNEVDQVVAKDVSQTTLLSSSNPSTVGQSVTFTATVTAAAPGSGTPTGTVTFEDGATVLGTGTLDANGQATITVTTLPAGTHQVVASYGGDGSFLPSDSAATAQAVNLTGTSVVLTSSLDPSTFGDEVTFTAKVSNDTTGVAVPTGTVTFSDGGTALGAAVALDGTGVATFAIKTLAVGTHAITATYSGDATNGAATASLSQVVKAPVEDGGVDGGPEGGVTDGGADAGTDAGVTPLPSLDAGATITPPTTPDHVDIQGGGCGCRTVNAPGPSLGGHAAFVAVALLSITRARRRRPSRGR